MYYLQEFFNRIGQKRSFAISVKAKNARNLIISISLIETILNEIEVRGRPRANDWQLDVALD